MKALNWIAPAALLGLLAAAGCHERSPDAAPKAADAPAAAEAGASAALADLPAEDRPLAQAQRLCPVTGEPLGEMGTPVKVSLKGQTVFLCCDGCKEKAARNPDKTLAAVEKLKADGK